MDRETANASYRMLLATLRWLASDFKTQKALLHPAFPLGDELALSWHDVYLLGPQFLEHGLLTSADLALAGRIDARFEEMSNHPGKSIWHDDAIEHAPEWGAIREEALALLAQMNEPYERPEMMCIGGVVNSTPYVPDHPEYATSRHPIPIPPICHRCARILTPGKGQFHVVRIEAFADPTVSIDPDVDPETLAAEYRALLDQMRTMSEQELMDQVHRRLTIILCEPCYNAWIENPTG